MAVAIGTEVRNDENIRTITKGIKWDIKILIVTYYIDGIHSIRHVLGVLHGKEETGLAIRTETDGDTTLYVQKEAGPVHILRPSIEGPTDFIHMNMNGMNFHNGNKEVRTRRVSLTDSIIVMGGQDDIEIEIEKGNGSRIH